MAPASISAAKRFRKAGEVQLTRLALVLIPRLPRRALLGISRFLGRSAYRLDRRSRRIGMQNLDLVYGDTLSTGEKSAILRQSFQTFALVLADIFWFTRSPRERLQRYVRFDDQALDFLKRTPLICVTGHLGNWETLGQAVANAGFSLHSVAAPLSNPAVDKLFIPSRQLSGQIIVSSEGALRRLLRVLKDGGRFAILLDQNTKPSEGGIYVPFLGLPAPISTGAAMLATRTGSNLAFGYALPQPDGTYQVISPHWIGADEIASMTEQGAERIDALTGRIVRHIEETIRTHPGCWLWMYKRWKHIAPGHDPAAYPDYARPLPENEQAKARVLPATAASRPG
jgi:KDO2-lipid IV(A) lauroyltransferase